MPVHNIRRYDGHIVFIETRLALNGKFHSSYSVHRMSEGTPLVHQVERSHQLTFDSQAKAVECAFQGARAWIDDGHRY